MSETEKKLATNRFSLVDLLVDIFLLGSHGHHSDEVHL